MNNIKLNKSIKNHTSFINDMVIFNDYLISTSNDKSIKIINIQTYSLIESLDFNYFIYSLALKNNLLIAGSFRMIYIYNLNNINKNINLDNKIELDDNWINCLITYKNLLITGSDDHTIKIYNFDNLNLIKTIKKHKSWLWCFCIYKNILISGSSICSIKTFNLDDNFKFIKNIDYLKNSIYCLKVYKGYLISSTWDKGNILTVYDISNDFNKILKNIEFFDKCWSILILNNNFISGTFEGYINFYDLSILEDLIKNKSNKAKFSKNESKVDNFKNEDMRYRVLENKYNKLESKFNNYLIKENNNFKIFNEKFNQNELANKILNDKIILLEEKNRQLEQKLNSLLSKNT